MTVPTCGAGCPRGVAVTALVTLLACAVSGDLAVSGNGEVSGAGFTSSDGPNVTAACEQVHLALGKVAGTMTVAWASGDAVAHSVTYYPTTRPEEKREAQGDARPLSLAGSRYTHVATMTGLKSGER